MQWQGTGEVKRPAFLVEEMFFQEIITIETDVNVAPLVAHFHFTG